MSLAWFALLIPVDASIRIGHRGWTIKAAITEVRRRWPKERLALAFSGWLAYHIGYLSYHSLKNWNALNSPRDDQMLRLDKWLFFGHSPAVLLHDVLGPTRRNLRVGGGLRVALLPGPAFVCRRDGVRQSNPRRLRLPRIISDAFASLHIGFTCMVLLMFRYYGFRRATRVMTVISSLS